MTHQTRYALRATCGVLACLTVACSADVTGPKPKLDPPSADAEPPPVAPEIVCKAQLETDVVVTGHGFSPIPIDIPDAPRTALPDVQLSLMQDLDGEPVDTSEPVLFSGDAEADPTNSALLTWQSREQMTFTITPTLTLANGDTGQLEAGIYDVTVLNPSGSKIATEHSLAVVDKPELTTLQPGVVCLAQGPRELVIGGSTLLRIEGDDAVLGVDGVGQNFAMTFDGADCAEIAHAGVKASRCTQATVTLAADSVDVGFPALTIHNPETAACQSEETVQLTVVPPPSIDRVVEPLHCLAQGARTFVIEGSDFLTVDGVPPAVSIGGVDFTPEPGGCEALEETTSALAVERCDTLTITAALDALPVGLHDVLVVNPQPAGCDATATAAVRIVPPPAVTQIEPALVCLDDGDRGLVISAAELLVVDDANPIVTVDGSVVDASNVTATGCAPDPTPVTGAGAPSVQICTGLMVTLVEGSVGLGTPDVTITNPEPAGCADTRSDLLAIVKGPVLSSAEAALVCTADMMRSIVITGTDLLEVDSVLPSVTIGTLSVDQVSVDSIDGCDAPVTFNGVTRRSCTTLTVTVAMNALQPGQPLVTVTNPVPAGCAAADTLLTVPPLLALTSLAPATVCQNTTPSLTATLEGAGFIRNGATDPSVTFDGVAVTPSFEEADCAALTGNGLTDVQVCDELSVDLTFTTSQTMTVGTLLPLLVSNATTAPGCPLTAQQNVLVVSPPTVSDVEIMGNPANVNEVCSDKSITLLITGTGLLDGATVRLISSQGTETGTLSGVSVDGTTGMVTFSMGLSYEAADVSFDLELETAGNCVSALVQNAVVVNPTPLVFFVDPPVVYNGFNIDVTVFTSGLGGASTFKKIEIQPTGATNRTELTPVLPLERPNRIVATVPVGFSDATYDVIVTSQLDCEGSLPGVFKIEDTVSVSLTVDPKFASDSESTAVTVTGSGFVDSPRYPRLYLTPASGVGSARALSAVELKSGTSLTAVIPAGLTAGDYELVMVNGDGSVLQATDTVLITGSAPTISSVTPQTTTNQNDTPATILGTNFELNNVSVNLLCRTATQSLAPLPATNVVWVSSTQVTATLPTQGLTTDSSGTTCVVELINDTEQTSYQYSAVTVKGSSGNLAAWRTTVPMQDGRRAHAFLAGRPTDTSRVLYAIGGDATLAAGGAISSVEAIGVDLFGDLIGTWQDVPAQGQLPEPRSHLGFARIDNFFYLTGGHGGATGGNNDARDTVYRAQVLDPLAGPEILDLDAQLGDDDGTAATTGLGAGLWFYKVAALFPATDPSNPGGESIAGELLNVQLPDLLATQNDIRKIELTLEWQPVAGASGYRIYRTPVADDALGVSNLQLLEEIDCGGVVCVCDSTPADPPAASEIPCDAEANTNPVFVDDGTLDLTASVTPVKGGALGAWHEPLVGNTGGALASLNTPREGHVTVAVKHPVQGAPGSDVRYVLYAFGGRDDSTTTGGYLDSYEWALVDVDPVTGEQSMSAWTVAGKTLETPKADLVAWVVTGQDTSVVYADPPAGFGEVYVFLGTGYNAAGNAVSELESGRLDLGTSAASGELAVAINDGTLDDEDGNVSRAGACYGAAGGFLNLFGGESTPLANPDNDRGSALVAAGTAPNLQPNTPNSWSAPGGGTLLTARAFCATVQESAFYFTSGGRDANDAILNTVERTLQ
jgi:hypothetical protein